MARETKALNDAVEMALYSLATGFKTTEIKEVKKDGKTTEITTITKEHQPDLKAIKLWLSTNDPGKWGDIKDTDSGKVDQLLEAIDRLTHEGEEI